MVRVKLYELLDIIIRLDNEMINKSINERKFTDIIVVSPLFNSHIVIG